MKILLVIDLQRQFRDDSCDHYDKCLKFIRKNRDNYYRVIGTIFSQYDTEHIQSENFQRYLDWLGCIKCDIRDIDYAPDDLYTKTTYTANINEMGITLDDEIDLIGCDSDACVMATAFALFDGGYKFSILSDYIYSSENEEYNKAALDIMRKNFGRAVV